MNKFSILFNILILLSYTVYKLYEKEIIMRILYLVLILLGILILSSYYAKKLDLPYPKHLDCKETLFQYIIFDKCTVKAPAQ